MPGAATFVRVLMMIGGILGLGLALFIGGIALLGMGLMDVPVTGLVVAVVPFAHSVIAITLAIRMGHPGRSVHTGVIVFQALSFLLLLPSLFLVLIGLGAESTQRFIGALMGFAEQVARGDYFSVLFIALPLAPALFSLLMIVLMLLPGPRAYYRSGA